jgi:hypothetical protein
MPARSLNRSCKKVYKNQNRLEFYGRNLKAPHGVTITPQLTTTLPNYSWSVDDIQDHDDRVVIRATLTPSHRVRDDLGDLTITLTYSDDPTNDLVQTYQEIYYSPDDPPP